MQEVAALFHNVRSAHNVGSLLRTADCAGLAEVFLSGYTPSPVDRFGREQKEIAKVALGAHKSVAWRYEKDPIKVVNELRAKGWMIAGVEQDKRAVDYRTFKIKQPTLFLFGNEVRGLSRQLRDHCDVLLEIPMHGKKESLNVGVAAGIVLFQMI